MNVRRIVIVALAGGVFLAYSAARQPVIRPGAPVSSGLGSVPDFSFIDQHGGKKALADFSGKPWLASFIFARCHDECPMIVSRMKALKAALPPSLQMASISVDPNDTPADLLRFSKAQRADWAFMVGKPAEVERFARGLKLGIGGKGPEDGALIHSNRLVLVDPAGAIRGYYDPENEEDAKRLIVDAAKL
ncbi:MAG: SCO family protein [Elusimicrobia bacterium]|nr:SCO family protein [Elusimicrobiota bacterium]